jgi:hypothetical protein
MNPARSLGPDVVRADLTTAWIYVVGPLVGAAVAVAVSWMLHGPPSEVSRLAAEGLLTAEPPSFSGSPAAESATSRNLGDS